MWHCDMKDRGKIATLGCIAAILGLMQPSHAKTAKNHVRRITHHSVSTHHVAAGHAAVRHVAYRHDVMHARHSTHRAEVHHASDRREVRHRESNRHGTEHHSLYHHVSYHHRIGRHSLHHYVRHADYLWCVPYAREISHVDLKGDAFLWWAEAAGRYARGSRPQIGSVLNFRSSGRIPLGHVAVVAQVVNNREILVNQANWVPDSVSRGVPVIDVSPNNNWSNVQVSTGGGRFGSTYPTYGFIYSHAPDRVIYAAGARTTEVAEAPVVHKIRLVAPNRTLR